MAAFVESSASSPSPYRAFSRVPTGPVIGKVISCLSAPGKERSRLLDKRRARRQSLSFFTLPRSSFLSSSGSRSDDPTVFSYPSPPSVRRSGSPFRSGSPSRVLNSFRFHSFPYNIHHARGHLYSTPGVKAGESFSILLPRLASPIGWN